MLSKTLAVCLSAVFIFNSFGFWIIFRLEQYSIRREADHAVSHHSASRPLYVITVAERERDSLDWRREGREVCYKGAMFDIVRLETRDGQLHIYCIPDKKETRLLAHLEGLMMSTSLSHHQPGPRKIASKLLKRFLSQRYMPCSVSLNLMPGSTSVELPGYTASFPLFVKRPDTPPPRTA